MYDKQLVIIFCNEVFGMTDRDMMVFIRLIREVSKSVRKTWNFNLTGPQLQLLDLLDAKGPLRMSELAEEIGISQSGATALVDRMLKGGYIARTRSDKDRRVVSIAITEAGKALLETFSQARDEAIEKFFRKLNPKERAEYIRLCQKMLD